MIATLPLEEMTIPDKISTMELLWEDLSNNAPDFASPAWHGDLLRQRAADLKQGKDEFVDWKDVKRDLLGSAL